MKRLRIGILLWLGSFLSPGVILAQEDLPVSIPVAGAPTPVAEKPTVEIQIGGGSTLPLSSALAGGYGLRFCLLGSVGSKITDEFSIMLTAQFHDFGRKNSPSGEFSTLEAAILAKYRFDQSKVRPYAFLGPGVSLNSEGDSYSSVQNIGLLVKAGAGVEYVLTENVSLFVQASASFDFIFNNYPDELNLYLPIQAGVDFDI